MCSTCGCGRPGDGSETHDPGHDHGHDGPASGIVRVEQALLAENDRHAAYVRGYFAGMGIRSFNLISAPGSGKTTAVTQHVAAAGGPVAWLTLDEGDRRPGRRVTTPFLPIDAAG